MAAIVVNERFVKLVRVDQSMAPAVSGSPLDAGTVVSQGADGRFVAGGGDGTEGVVVETVLTTNAPISVLKRGILDLGADVLAATNPGTPVFATAAGVLDNAATGNTAVGVVEQGRGDLDGEGVNRKYLRVNL